LLAGDGAPEIAIAGKPGSYRVCVRAHDLRHTRDSVGVWLASDGKPEIAIAGKPVSYGFCVRANHLRHTAIP
ncbi:hypothetical protein, partial [Pseudomonas mandelii]|uniref:hypothetical protein n=1 Tax=Pseudomonas mandelii TaxID=75612 RepID=UPI00224ADE07